MKKLVKEIKINDEVKALKNVKKYLDSVKVKFNAQYLDEIKGNKNVIRKFTPVVTVDAYNLLTSDPVGIAMKKVKENSIAMMEIRYDESVVGKVVARKKGEKVKLYIETEDKKLIEPILTIF